MGSYPAPHNVERESKDRRIGQLREIGTTKVGFGNR